MHKLCPCRLQPVGGVFPAASPFTQNDRQNLLYWPAQEFFSQGPKIHRGSRVETRGRNTTNTIRRKSALLFSPWSLENFSWVGSGYGESGCHTEPSYQSWLPSTFWFFKWTNPSKCCCKLLFLHVGSALFSEDLNALQKDPKTTKSLSLQGFFSTIALLML